MAVLIQIAEGIEAGARVLPQLSESVAVILLAVAAQLVTLLILVWLFRALFAGLLTGARDALQDIGRGLEGLAGEVRALVQEVRDSHRDIRRDLEELRRDAREREERQERQERHERNEREERRRQ